MNVFSISSATLFFTSTGLALILYFANRKSKVIRAWVLESVPVSLWGLTLYGVTTAPNESTALLWQYLLDISAIFVPIFYYNFVVELFNLGKKKFRIIIMLAGISLSIFSISNLFKLGVTPKYYSYWVLPGKYYFLFPIFITVLVILSLVTLLEIYHDKASIKNDKKKALLLFWGYLVASVTGITNFFPQLFNIYPFGNFFIVFYFLFMGYAIIRFELLNVKIISTQLISGVVVLVMLFNLLGSQNIEDWITAFILLIFTVIFGILLVRSVQKEVKQREKIEQLASDLKRTNSDLEIANNKLKELDQLKTEFISLATHQIRSPLTAIKGYVSLIQEGDYGPISNEVKNALDIIYKSTNNLVTIVGDFLDVSRIEQGRMKYDLSNFDLKELLEQVIEEYKHSIDQKGLKLEYTFKENTDFEVYADQGKIKQIIGNVIDNSIKYTPNGTISILLTKENDKIRVKISDTGVGIPKATLPKLFQKFTRAENANEANILGTGLGLYVAKMMIEAQHGKIWAESEGQGKGSQFYIELALPD